MDDAALLATLEPEAGRLLDVHLARAREWFPHEMVPWSRGRDFEPGEEWDPDAYPLPDAVRSSLLVNILTEDNLPYYFHAIASVFGRDTAWGEWNRRWTAEENRHSIVLRDWLTVTRALDPVALERARMAQLCTGFDGAERGVLDGLVYVTLQELATRIAHHNTGRLLDDGPGAAIATRLAADENLHFLFYRDVTTAALAVDPSATVCAIERQVRTFEMPGTGIEGFTAHAAAIAGAGIYDFSVHYNQIIVPVVERCWKIDELTGLTDEAERARTALRRFNARLGRVARMQSEQRQETVAAVAG